MTNKEALDIVMKMAATYWHIDEPDCEAGQKQLEAIAQMEDYYNDVLED